MTGQAVQIMGEEHAEIPAKLKGTFTCYRCGQRFDNKFKHRHRVKTGWSIGRSFRAYYHTVNLCPTCYDKQIRRERIEMIIIVAIIVVIVLWLRAR